METTLDENMNTLQKIAFTPLTQLSEETKELIGKSLAPNTLRTYQYAIKKLVESLGDQTLNDPVFAQYLANLFATGKVPATINLVIIAVKWAAKMNAINLHTTIGPVTQSILLEIYGGKAENDAMARYKYGKGS